MKFFRKPTPAEKEKWARLSDAMAAAVAASLPWSTSATSILLVVWLITLIPSIEPDDLQTIMRRPAAWLPVLLVLLAIAGIAWSPVSLAERIRGFDSFLKLLALPLLFVQFRRSDRALWVFGAFLVSGTLLLIASGITMFPVPFRKDYGLVVKDYIAQSAVFTLCAFGAMYLAIDAFRRGRRWVAAAFAALCALFLANIFYVISSRTAIVIIPFVTLVLFFVQFGWRRTAWLAAGVAVLAGIVWFSSPHVRGRIGALTSEFELYKSDNIRTSVGERIEFLTRSLLAVKQAPVIGHGTGSIREVFRRSAVGEGSTASGVVTTNPHNQMLAVAIQLGALGTALLIAMWIAHAWLFRGGGLAAWVGMLVVAQNVLGSLANSHLFDFMHGWIYIFAVGAAGGMTMRSGHARPAETAST